LNASSGLRAVIGAIRENAELSPELGLRNCILDDGALDDGAVWLSYAEAVTKAAHISGRLREYRGGVALISVRNETESALAVLASWAAGLATMIVDPALDENAYQGLLAAFRPEIRYRPGAGFVATGSPTSPLCNAPSILLSTSGTTGTTKFVHLPENAVLANAAQIAEVLSIDAPDVAVAHLPLHYSYGLSVLFSHLERGAATFLTESRVTSPDTFSKIAAAGGTHFPGVPFHYTTLARFGLDRVAPPSVKTFTQAGGHLDQNLRDNIYRQASARGAKFFVMYGQTEASPRMTTLPHERFPAKPASVGRALPGGRITIVDDDDSPLPPGDVGRIVYNGPNVMWGYATSRECLSNGDELNGRLDTGDMGWIDAEGDLFISGRNQRFAKIAGLRIGLDEIERKLIPDFDVALLPDAESEAVLVFHTDRSSREAELRVRLNQMSEQYRIPRKSFVIKPVDSIPLKSSGKTDFAHLRELM